MAGIKFNGCLKELVETVVFTFYFDFYHAG